MEARLYSLLLLVLVSALVRSDTTNDKPGDSQVQKSTKSYLVKYPQIKQHKVKKTLPAYIAIEIVDVPQANQSRRENSKRTVDGGLGYGYLNPYDSRTPTRKFMVYKYSQENIPPFPYRRQNYGIDDTNIQKSIGLHLSSTVSYVPNSAEQALRQHQQQYLLQQQLLQQQQQQSENSYYPQYHSVPQQQMVPVLILRVYNNQLTGGSNAPSQAHPYPDSNSLDLQSLLQNYIRQHLYAQQPNYVQPLENNQQYSPPQEQHVPSQQYHQATNYHLPVQQYPQTQTYYRPTAAADHADLATYENYPSNSHTRVIFKSGNNGHLPTSESQPLGVGKLSIPIYRAPEVTYPEVEEQPPVQYVYTKVAEPQQYAYVYPQEQPVDSQESSSFGQDDQYYSQDSHQQQQQQETQDEETEQDQQENQVPHNYHAHPDVKQDRRDKRHENEKDTTKRDKS